MRTRRRNEMDNEQYKLTTRRLIGLCTAIPFVLTCCFIGVWGILQNLEIYVIAIIELIGVALGFILGYYFGKKTSEE
jgi:quinol-cytochrome oxidoreductase complex cytochrome b subunit